VDLVASLLTFALGAAAIVLAQWVQAWRELKLDRTRRSDDRAIDRGRTEARTLAALQEALADLRLATGELNVAMDANPAPALELGAYSASFSATRLNASRILSDPLREAAESAALAATFVASTTDASARRDLLAAFFKATNQAEQLLGPELRELIRAGHLKSE